jgi:hypothetical protein
VPGWALNQLIKSVMFTTKLNHASPRNSLIRATGKAISLISTVNVHP